MKQEWRSRLSAWLMVATFVIALVAGPALYVSTVIEDEDAFVAVADKAFANPEVRRSVATAATVVTVEAIANDETISAALPDQVRTFAVPLTQLATEQLTDGVFEALETDIAVDARDSALREVHSGFTAEGDDITIDLRAVLVRTTRELAGPAVGAGVAKLVSGSETGRFTLAERGSTNGWLVDVVQGVPVAGSLIAVLFLITLAAAILFAPDRRRALSTTGLTVAGAAFVATLIVSFAAAVAAGTSPIGQAIADVITADFAQHQRGLVINGLILAAIGLLLGDRPSAVALRALPKDLLHRRRVGIDRFAAIFGDNPALARMVGWVGGAFLLALWSTPTWRVVISIVTLTLAFQFCVWIVVSQSEAATHLRQRFEISAQVTSSQPSTRRRVNAALLIGLVFLFWPAWSRSLFVAFFIVSAVLQAALDARTARRLAADDATEQQPTTVGISRRRYAISAFAMGVTVLVGVAATSNATERTEAATECNGSADLCDRRIDEVVFAGSHNAMSSNALGWDLALQNGDMVTQLDHGVRALLIDALYWSDDGALDGGTEAASATIEAALSDDRPLPGTWLCHGFCALGATELVSGLADISIWLDENPREVLIIIVQDEISTDDLETAFNASGLRNKAYAHESGTPFPTLGELIERGERVLVYGENGGTPDTWFQNGYEATFQETPFAFAVRNEFNCDDNRGNEENPLFLINHWITTGIPVEEAAQVINRSDVLLERVASCEQERGRKPTILAVDFVETGDLIAVVEELNAGS